MYIKNDVLNISYKGQSAVLSAKIENPLAKDTDQDGIPDFSEPNYNTDPFDPDSDRDGYLDGEEILSGFNPMVNESVGPAFSESKTKPGNVTENFIHTVVAGIYAGDLKPTSIKFNESIDMVSLAILDDSYQILADPIPEEGFHLTNNSKESQEEYLKTIASILEGPFLDQFLAQGAIMQKAIQELAVNQTGEASSILKNYSVTVTGTYTRLLSVPVPPKWKTFHLKLLGVFRRMALSHNALANIEKDPLLAFTALNDMPNTLIYIESTIIQDLKRLVKEDGLTVPPSALFEVLTLLNN
ncbi:MAG: hypothetical protein COV29_04545 [Candidatus Yanofskybacteria bacterium CG10_big_fil_rev_8_21_14_0_10_36_16]|uniref:EF-hand domain-containing protein n=1 Tax=Candidatus Yanofskybacteria bacterium CG10_big_fil_rev_8_21_14_0_10_36_16 TaxID=1975096 RepID=A0A2J0Q984_9BACT|nr:MAG: hypothetical protein COV29_04545 [Candidatus Yanofskybacteria bacterium CG10_big_fil_rev_8_21_14_0_10_36_16]